MPSSNSYRSGWACFVKRSSNTASQPVIIRGTLRGRFRTRRQCPIYISAGVAWDMVFENEITTVLLEKRERSTSTAIAKDEPRVRSVAKKILVEIRHGPKLRSKGLFWHRTDQRVAVNVPCTRVKRVSEVYRCSRSENDTDAPRCKFVKGTSVYVGGVFGPE
ncbi:hypothetical protein BCV70DRAFT_202939 [Testicularia cyperi]|uniref:Uncharacterized protein n=1 Tax=Testicularia cyperi TaxID=1882483 RepID=A0A317XG75_9BASI|nr:hypothetical protein BCV70DRAFT_202939 [Testicularia cyperi]